MGMIKSLLVEQEVLDASVDIDKFLQDNNVIDGSIINKFILDKSVFRDQSEAAEWVQDKFYPTDNVEEIDGNFVFTIFDDSEFIDTSLVTVEIRRGVKTVVGLLKPVSVDSPFFLSLRNEDGIKLSENLPHVIELAKVIKGFHVSYGEVEITKETLISFRDNFDNKVTGVDISIDYDHETREAAGWIKSVFLDPTGTVLMGEIRWTPKGALALKDREFRYYSPEFSFNYEHPHNPGTFMGPTMLGGGLVNRPFLKMEAIVSLKDKQKGVPKMDTIALTEHKAVVSGLEKSIAEYKLSEATAKDLIKTLKESNESTSKELTEIKEEKAKAEKTAKHDLLFSEGKINAAQLTALTEGKEMLEVLLLGEKMHTKPKGKDGENEGTVTMSGEEKAIAAKLGLTDEEFVKYNK